MTLRGVVFWLVVAGIAVWLMKSGTDAPAHAGHQAGHGVRGAFAFFTGLFGGL